MKAERAQEIRRKLTAAADEFRAAAEDEMSFHGSVYNVFQLMKENFALEGKARNLSRRWGIDDCNCA